MFSCDRLRSKRVSYDRRRLDRMPVLLSLDVYSSESSELLAFIVRIRVEDSRGTAV